MTHGHQLPLPFTHRPGFSSADFLPDASNAEALAWLGRVPDWPEGRLLLWGDAGCGKTHLLHIWAERAGARLLCGPSLQQGLLEVPRAGLAVDDADNPASERVLLHLLNATREQGVPVLLASHQPPSRWPVQLADLASRLRAITTVRIAPPGPDLLRGLLLRLMADRQLRPDDGLLDWMLQRLPRDPGSLRAAVARLDQAALSTGRRVSRSLAAEVFQNRHCA